jgi:hypothetical protein
MSPVLKSFAKLSGADARRALDANRAAESAHTHTPQIISLRRQQKTPINGPINGALGIIQSEPQGGAVLQRKNDR